MSLFLKILESSSCGFTPAYLGLKWHHYFSDYHRNRLSKPKLSPLCNVVEKGRQELMLGKHKLHIVFLYKQSKWNACTSIHAEMLHLVLEGLEMIGKD